MLYRIYIKRILDIICALAAMIVFCWLYVIVAILVKTKLGSPVIFSQERPGMIDPKTGKERIFKLYKFRSMYMDAEKRKAELMAQNKMGNDMMFKMDDDPRITKVGKFIRKTSLDELPQLINVLKGDMALIGPRPLLIRYLDLYSPEQARRHEVRPGITGWAQVNGFRGDTSIEGRIQCDLYYIEIPDINPDAMNTYYSIEFDSNSVCFGPYSYVYSVLNKYSSNSEKADLVDLVCALFEYGNAASNYAGK